MLFPTDSRSDVHYADSIFEVARRDNEPSAEWKNPSNCQHQHAFASVHDEMSGLTVANRGLQEYELVRDGRSTIAVTLVRSVAELGDWGVFLTPEAQCLRPCTAELYVIPHDGGGEEPAFAAYEEAYKYQIPWQTIQIRPEISGAGRELADRHPLPASLSFLQWSGAGMAFSSLKLNEQTGDWMARWYNMGKRGTELSFRMSAAIGAESAYRSGILEDAGAELAAENGAELPAGGCEIVTVGIRPASVFR
jgi:alpha-mannosidase